MIHMQPRRQMLLIAVILKLFSQLTLVLDYPGCSFADDYLVQKCHVQPPKQMSIATSQGINLQKNIIFSYLLHPFLCAKNSLLHLSYEGASPSMWVFHLSQVQKYLTLKLKQWSKKLIIFLNIKNYKIIIRI